jgi:hypothetical protein
MRSYKKYLFILCLGFAACQVDKEVKPKLQNDVQEFSFLKMVIEGDTIGQSLNYYKTVMASYNESTANIIFRDFEYFGFDDMQLPFENYFDKISRLYFEFRTEGTDLSSRIGKTMELTRKFDVNDNRLEFAINYRGRSLVYAHYGGETVTYLEMKDTVIDNKNYELSHLAFAYLFLLDDDGNEYIATDIELKQVARKD